MIIPLLQGLWATLRHIFGRRFTISYPFERKEMPPRARWKLVLQRNEDGTERCIACQLCAAACVSECIYIEGEENDPRAPVSRGERYAKAWLWDMGRCIFCGYCVEACPEEALNMSADFELAQNSRREMVLGKEELTLPPDQPARFAWMGFYRRGGEGEEPLSSAAEVRSRETDYFKGRGEEFRGNRFEPAWRKRQLEE